METDTTLLRMLRAMELLRRAIDSHNGNYGLRSQCYESRARAVLDMDHAGERQWAERYPGMKEDGL